MLRALLLTGTGTAFLQVELGGGHGETSTASDEPLWSPAGKIVGRHLAPFLAELGVLEVAPEPDEDALRIELRRRRSGELPAGLCRSAGRSSPFAPVSRVDVSLKAALAWYRRFGRDLPWRRTRDPYAILVSEVMLQQTQVERVVPRYLAWLERWPTRQGTRRGAPRRRDPRVAGARLQPAGGESPPGGAADRGEWLA